MKHKNFKSFITIALVLIIAPIQFAYPQADKIAPESPPNQSIRNKLMTEQEVTFFQVKQIISSKCISCHTSNSQWTDFSSLMSDEKLWVNANLVVPKKSADSILYKYLQGTGHSPAPFSTMPHGGTLTNTELALIKNWIDSMPEYENSSSIDQRAKYTLKIYCSKCHNSTSPSSGNLNYIDDIPKLVANQKIIPRSPAEQSPLYSRLVSTTNPMPPSGARPSAAEISNIKQWIENVVPPIQTLSDEAVFHRCYGQMVRKRAPDSHPLLISVKNGTMTADQACLTLLDKARFTASNNTLRLANTNDEESKSILRTFHTFHQTWWQEDAKLPDNIYATIDHQMADGGHINFLTYAAFAPNVRYDSILKENRALRARRNRGNWQVPISNDNFIPSYEIEQGELIGFDIYPEGNGSWWDMQGVEQTTVKGTDSGSQPFISKRAYGGGLIGLQSFIWHFSGYPFMRDRSNGAVRVPRRWSKTIYQSLLCRDIPLLRKTDVTSQVADYLNRYPNPVDHVPFRPDSTCMSCHSAIDPMAGFLRNISFIRTDIPRTAPAEAERQAHIRMLGGLATSDTEKLGFHMIQPDTSFSSRPPNGQIFYRSYDGTLINEKISATSPEDALTKLGQSLSTKDDFYICAASQYFNFLTGIKVNLLDYMDPRNGGTISEGDLYYRNLVKGYALGTTGKPGLKEHQSIRTLIRDIISSPLYHNEGMRDKK
jgi:hypothetical protein